MVRQVYKGRVADIGTDLSDAFTAFTTGNTAALTEILSRKGSGTTVDTASPKAVPAPLGPGAVQGSGLVAGAIAAAGISGAALRRGQAAKGYRWAATGPDYYDCSGLMWRSAQDCGFKGARFTTATVRFAKQMIEIPAPGTMGPFVGNVTAATVNDLIVWTAGHMGVITKPGYFYSARSVHSGIGESKIEGFEAGPRKYYRLVTK